MLRHSLGPSIQIVTEFEDAIPPIQVDPNQLELALLNLALNGRDAMPGGGRLTISARRERIESGQIPGLPHGDYVCIAERDTGHGMDEMTLKRATEPFYTTKGAGRGTGLGLSMVDGLVAQSGGTMRIASRPGLGTLVELFLPVSGEAVGEWPISSAPVSGKALRSYRILVVDDDPNVATGTVAMLEDLGHCAIESGSAEEALRLLQSDPSIEMVITDHAMPGMTGAELAARVRQTWPYLPVAIATGYAEVNSDCSIDLPHLRKPYTQQELASLLSSLIGGAPKQSAQIVTE